MKTDRPVNLSLLRFSWPLAALASITHRVSGAILFIGMAFLLYAADLALQSEAGFIEAQMLLATPIGKCVLLGLMAALIYHLIAGIKHLLLDFHIADSLESAKRAAQLTMVVSLVLTVLAGVWLW